MPTATSIRARNPLAVHSHLTPRDRALLALLADHQVLTGGQLTRVFFTHVRTCQLRLDVLRRLDLLARFRYARPYGGTEPWKWVLGLAGAQFQAAAAARRSPTARAHREHLLRLSARPDLDHLLASNEFFVRLHRAARTSGNARLDRWWSEAATAARFAAIQPDGHGLWTAGGRTTGFFLETDLGTENLTRLIGKLVGYARLAAAGGPTYPVLFWLPTPERETHLQQLLRDHPAEVPVATASHQVDPAGPVWLPADGWQRVPLHDLPSEHGPHCANNPNWRDGHLDLTDQCPGSSWTLG